MIVHPQQALSYSLDPIGLRQLAADAVGGGAFSELDLYLGRIADELELARETARALGDALDDERKTLEARLAGLRESRDSAEAFLREQGEEIRRLKAANHKLTCELAEKAWDWDRCREALGQAATRIDDLDRKLAAAGTESAPAAPSRTLDPIVFRCPWKERFVRAGKILNEPSPHPHVPGAFATRIEVEPGSLATVGPDGITFHEAVMTVHYSTAEFARS